MAVTENTPDSAARFENEKERESTLRGDVEATLAALRESEEQHRLIFENVRDFAIFSADVDGRINKWNPGAENFFGYTQSEILGQRMEVLYTPEDNAVGRAASERETAARTGSAQDQRWHVRKDGTRFFVFGRVNALYDDAGALRGFIKVARDITQRKQMEDRLRQNEQLHRLILENARDFAIFTFDFSGIIQTWNPGAEHVFGFQQDEIIGKDIAQLYLPEDRANGVPERERVEAIEKDGSADDRWHLHKDGSRIFVTGAVRPLVDSAGNLHGFAKIGRDITSRKTLEEELMQARENLEAVVMERTDKLRQTVAQLEAFSYSLSHDMRAPLRAMQGFAEITLAQYGEFLTEDGRANVQKIINSAQRLDRLILDVLSYSKISKRAVGLTTVDLDTLVPQIIGERPTLQRPDVQITIEHPLLPVLGHGGFLTQCLSNILDNAVKFVPNGTKPRVRVWTELMDSHVRLCIEDNGIGIEIKQQERIFEMFHRLHHSDDYSGTGMGLAIVRKAVEQMGGQVGLESEPGKGCRFWLQLAKGGGS